MRIGLDIGTTSCKAVVFDDHLNIVDERKLGYTTYTNHLGYASQKPKDILAAVKGVLEPLVALHQIESISLSSAMHSLLLAGDFEHLTDMILWSDTRASSVVSPRSYPEVYLRTGLPIHPMSPFAKLLWFQKYEPEVLALTLSIKDIKSLVFNYLTGSNVLDYSVASGTGLFNIHSLDWDAEILDIVGIEASMLPRLVDVDYCEPGLFMVKGISIHIGASDGCLSNVGLGAIHEGDFAINLGTSAAIRTISDRIHIDPESQNFCYYLNKDQWVIGHASSNAGNVFNWLQSQHPGLEYADIARIAADVDSESLVFIPYINGERSTDWDGSYRGSYFGISSSHTAEAMIKAALEGVFYNIRKLYEAMPIANTGSLRVGGGLLAADALKSLFATLLGRTIETLNYEEAACLGAVLLLSGDTLELEKQVIKPQESENNGAYARYLSIDLKYRELMRHLSENK